MDVREVDHAVGCEGRLAQAVEIVQIAARRLGARCVQGGRGSVRSGQPYHPASRLEQAFNDQ